jgi:hypothetical protein
MPARSLLLERLPDALLLVIINNSRVFNGLAQTCKRLCRLVRNSMRPSVRPTRLSLEFTIAIRSIDLKA